MNAHPEAAERPADEAVEKAEGPPPEQAAGARTATAAQGGEGSEPDDADALTAAAARWLDLWERALAEIARRGP